MKALVCGGFGFAGQYLVYGLLKKGYEVILIGREKKKESIGERLEELVNNNAYVNPEFQIDKSLLKKIKVLAGDLSLKDFGLSEKDREFLNNEKLDVIYNSAAILRYEKKYRDLCFCANVEGTKKLLDLAVKKQCRYIHISTAFITGSEVKSGELIEEKFYNSSDFPNVYIESKAVAEQLVKKYKEDFNLDYLIFRFPALVGDSKTGFSNSVFGFYEYVAAIEAVSKRVNGGTQIRFAAAPDGTANLLPTDIAIKCVLEICSAAKPEKLIFNITDDHPLNPAQVGELLGKLFKIPLVATNPGLLKGNKTITERLFAKLTTKNSFLAQHIYRFDNSNSEKQLGHKVTAGWDKSINYFKLLKKGFEEHVIEHNT